MEEGELRALIDAASRALASAPPCNDLDSELARTCKEVVRLQDVLDRSLERPDALKGMTSLPSTDVLCEAWEMRRS
eukprot:3042288-Amphidinium_carterae.1